MNIPIANGVEGRTRNLLLIALRRILRPLVRLLLEHDVKYTMVLEELKRVYVSVADEEFKLGSKPQTDSRITLLTGVHRKDVRRIRDEVVSTYPEPRRLSLSAQIVGVWLRNPAYLDSNGQPLPLPRLASSGGENSFESLVAKISKDFRARPVLDEWLNLGVVKLDAQDRVHLNIQAFIPNQNLEEKLGYLSMNIHDHLAATVNNLSLKRIPFLERCVNYQGLTQENIDILHEAAKESGMQAITSLNRLAVALKAGQENHPEIQAGTPLKRMNFGVYFYSSADDKAQPESESIDNKPNNQ